MIVPMKKVSVLVLDTQKKRALHELRRLGLLHVEETQMTGNPDQHLSDLQDRLTDITNSLFTLEERVKKDKPQKEAAAEEALAVARKTARLMEEKKLSAEQIHAHRSELDRLQKWGDLDPEELQALEAKGIRLIPCEMPRTAYEQVDKEITTVPIHKDKDTVRFLIVDRGSDADAIDGLAFWHVKLPKASTKTIKAEITALEQRGKAIEQELDGCAEYHGSLKKAAAALEKEIRLETYAAGMFSEVLSEASSHAVALSCLTGYVPAEELGKLQEAAKQNAWGLAAADPTEEDNVPTQLRNNKFVSLIYPMTDFLGTVPGYFEYDISGWFLAFILIFFAIIFGDGGYGLLIAGVAAALAFKSKKAGEPVPPFYYLMGLLGGATIAWGTMTCTWFGIDPELLPNWLCKLSIPLLSNVNAETIWYPFWTNGAAGLTTTQNVQIFCFSLALIHLCVAHVKGLVRSRTSLKALGELGSILQLVGMFYVVLSLVVNAEVFPLGLVLGGIPVGTGAIGLVGVGFLLGFIFSSYEGSIKDSILDSFKNIVSVLLGVVNVFSDIVSYIRLWAVGLAGSAISATVNEMAGPWLGHLTFVIFAVILLVFGHGLNMILNVLSVIVHGVRLNTLEFSTHLNMSWSGHKFDPFKE